MNDHIGDDAELYALGALEPHERDAVDAHLAVCGACSRAVAAAERVTLGLSAIDWSSSGAAKLANAARSPQTARRFKDPAWYAAAAFVIAVGLGALLANQLVTANHLRRDDDVAFATLATSHFLHASFQPKTKSAPAAKVLYARDGTWLYVVVDGRAEGDRLIDTTSQTEPSELGEERARGTTAVAFVRPPRRVRGLALEDASGIAIATVTLTYPRTSP